VSVHLSINDRETTATAGVTLFESAESLGIRVPTSCLRNGKCKECVVEVEAGADLLSPPTPAERHLTPPFRLSCQAHIAAGAGEVRCHTMRRGQMRIERHTVSIPAGRLAQPRLDPAVTRRGDSILIDGSEITRAPGPLHGLAVDLGTTTIVIRLIDLESGELVADASFENPQRFGGSDVMSRIHYDTTHPGKLLRRTTAGYLSHAIEALPADPLTIYEVVVVGNPTMRDLFFRQNVYSIGQTPYRSITEIDMEAGRRATTSLVETGRRSLLPVHPRARVYGAPIISGHVGADAAACMLAVGLPAEDRLVAIMDIGTNTELVVGNRKRILAASCPAGPAFEGGAIAHGMPALDGAIENVRIDDDGRVEIAVIGGGRPQGICGSGLIAALSELRRTGRINELGRFEDGSDRFVLDHASGIALFERDINELAQAKGANVAGLRTVMDRYGAAFDDIGVFYLAGGFGRHIDIQAAKRIGLVPDVPDDRIVRIGNAAIEGAVATLLSRSRRAELEAVVRTVEHCRLETHPDFFDFFVFGCQFAPMSETFGATP
jgi:uncharacterized 2Fe-2S/4Fe-4S cluster protein (DUF4445 family)